MTAEQDGFDWRLQFYAAIGALILFVPVMISSIDFVFSFVAAAPIISFILLVVVIRKKALRRLAVLSMLVVYLGVSWVLVKNSDELRATTRWLLWSKEYKTKILAQPDSANGALRHMEWDGWGFPGAGNTLVYLVFDPNDSLSSAARNDFPGKYSGIPCEVPRIRRLESNYYSVLFYTETDWDHCN